jgi:hypothetical protein
MEARRQPPAIDIDASHRENRKVIFTGSLGILISIFAFLLGLGFLWTGVKYRSFGYILAGLCFAPISVFQTVMLVRMVISLIKKISQRNRWIKNAVPIQVDIADRKAEYNAYAESEDEAWDCELTLRLPARVIHQGEDQLVKASVSKRIYAKYESRKVVRAYYSPTDIYTFMLEGE